MNLASPFRALLLAPLLLATPAAAAPLEVTVTNVRNSHGEVRIAVCTRQQFLNPTCDHVAHVPAHPGAVTLHLDIPPGIWSAQAFHDENTNTTIDTTLFGIPTEGLGFSNDARFRFGPPTFDDAAFQLPPAGGRIRFTLRYTF